MSTVNTLELRKFVAPEFVFGEGARLLAGQYARNLGARKVLVVTDSGIIEARWTAQVIESLQDEGLAYQVFSSVTSNPREQEVMSGADVFRSEKCDAIVAVGGGSPMDCAKGIGIVSTNRRHILDFEGIDQVSAPGPPLICIPTTAGSSADVSQFAIISDTQRNVKIAIVSKTVVPDAALIDPTTTTTMDEHLTACTGLDTLTHAIEAYCSNASSPVTDLHALQAVRLVSSSLLVTLSRPKDMGLRSSMMLGCLHAGLAFSNASLGAVHAMAHSLGGLLDLPHGHCNAILLPFVMDFNFSTVPDRYYAIGQAMGLDLTGMTPAVKNSTVLGEIERLKKGAQVSQSLAQIGASRSDIPTLARNAMNDACMVTNPRRPSQKDIEAIYEKAF